MKDFFKKPYRWAILFTSLLILTFTYALLDTFVIPKTLTAIAIVDPTKEPADATEPPVIIKEPVITDTSYEDNEIQITIEQVREYNSDIYIADIYLKDATYLKTALAKDTFGKNIKEKTSVMAKKKNAILAVNGDYYGFRTEGFVLRNGQLLRDTARKSGIDDALVIDRNGDFSIIDERKTNLNILDLNSIWQILTFGPALVKDGEIKVNKDTEVAQAMNSNPRTAIGQVSYLHYLIIVSDGRTSKSKGLSLYQLANLFLDRGCTTAYNLDGGGSSTMYFNGKIINNPTDGRSFEERAVSDIVYIGY